MSFDPLTVVFAVVAILVVWKLNSVLGRNTGFQRDRPSAEPNRRFSGRGEEPAPSNVVRLPGATPAGDAARWTPFLDEGATGAAAGLDAVAAADPGFTPGPFLEGARTAHEAIVTAFAAGERRTLQNLLAPEVYDGFNAAMLDREKNGEKLTTTIVADADAKIRSAALEGHVARLAVRFQSKQISATHGPKGELRGGSPDSVADMDDVWTFARDVTSADPNWKLVATEAGR